MKIKILPAAPILLTLVFLSAGCGLQRSVSINQARYSPAFSASPFSYYQGKQINLVKFVNTAEKTDFFSYYSPGMQIEYISHDTNLGSYFRSCFREGFRSVGMRVLEDEAFPTNIPEFQLTIATLNDSKLEFRATVTLNGHPVMQKLYAVTMAPVEEKDVAKLEKRAYAMVDKAITAVLADPAFKKSWD